MVYDVDPNQVICEVVSSLVSVDEGNCFLWEGTNLWVSIQSQLCALVLFRKVHATVIVEDL